jgi:hypothetical protein
VKNWPNMVRKLLAGMASCTGAPPTPTTGLLRKMFDPVSTDTRLLISRGRESTTKVLVSL